MPGKVGRSGRKPADVEKADGDLLYELWETPFSKADLKKKLEGGVYSIKEAFIAKALSGEASILRAIFNKLYPEIVMDDPDKARRYVIKRGEKYAAKRKATGGSSGDSGLGSARESGEDRG